MLMGNIFGVDGVIVVVILLALVFGGSAIPKLARNLGSAKNEFEKGLKASKPADSADSDTPPSSRPSDTDTPS